LKSSNIVILHLFFYWFAKTTKLRKAK
ncbi:hypothetical protein CLOP_g8386, partial [Closterium sp. NIES-67]